MFGNIEIWVFVLHFARPMAKCNLSSAFPRPPPPPWPTRSGAHAARDSLCQWGPMVNPEWWCVSRLSLQRACIIYVPHAAIAARVRALSTPITYVIGTVLSACTTYIAGTYTLSSYHDGSITDNTHSPPIIHRRYMHACDIASTSCTTLNQTRNRTSLEACKIMSCAGGDGDYAQHTAPT